MCALLSLFLFACSSEKEQEKGMEQSQEPMEMKADSMVTDSMEMNEDATNEEDSDAEKKDEKDND
jgi:hypothetical protein